MATETTTKLTYEDYVVLPNDGRRYQIIDGDLYVNPAPNVRHQVIVGNIFGHLWVYFQKHGGGRVFGSPVDVLLSRENIVQPDIAVVLKARAAIITRRGIEGAPNIIVEVLSGGTRRTDEIIKRKLYEESGVQEYWIADPDVDTLKIYRTAVHKFERAAEITSEEGGALTSPLLPEFSVDIRAIFTE
jgi:Uma2 family endonuclease